jgi:DNA-binding NtrC family response regulator
MSDSRKSDSNSQDTMFLAVIGSTDFCRRIRAITLNSGINIKVCAGSITEAWSLILTNKPNTIIFEIGFQHDQQLQIKLRELMLQIKERFAEQMMIAIAITSPEKIYFAGDLLFADSESLKPSKLVDTYLATPPSNIPSVQTLASQVINVMELFSKELERRRTGAIPLPALGAEGWVQSLADVKSRELWMNWIPRYATYTNENPIIVGATGTGKTNIAYALHLLSKRKGKFISMTPRDFSSSELVQVELFGAVAGAYTGAVDKWGLVKAAEEGTLFIDELQSIDKDLQGKIITFIENKVYRRVGSAESIEADVRFIFASNRSLYDMIESDTLRDDFAYRLERLQLDLQPLAERRLDIVSALAYALAKIRRQRPLRNPISGVDSNAYRLLFGHHWPGNLRQLENSVAKLCELTDMQGHVLINERVVKEAFSSELSGRVGSIHELFSEASRSLLKISNNSPINSLNDAIAKFTECIRSSALEATGGNVERASEIIEDNPDLMALVAESLLAKLEIADKK